MLPEDPGAARIADRDRDRVVALLRMHCTEGRLTLDEFSDRVGDVYNARTQVDLDATVRDLPVLWDPPASPAGAGREHGSPSQRGAVRWLVAVFGSSAQRGRYRLADESAAIALFGDCVLDLSQALIDGPAPIVNAVAIFGDVVVIVPDGIDAQLQGIAIFGSKRCQVSGVTPVAGSPVVHVRAAAVFGDVQVRPPHPRDGRRRGRFGRR